ncbi:hypothetical protein [Parendozoicomonas sp. Alg238-R29]|uniref:hypothetical protein n=1 Tax=Parendozoicomonas sp. Alg238-R29 TaxID=2993446 RepID=UPI00248E93F3|nr:hypothetical protein [Parendozoicomonas sp. Alg238-R29]
MERLQVPTTHLLCRDDLSQEKQAVLQELQKAVASKNRTVSGLDLALSTEIRKRLSIKGADVSSALSGLPRSRLRSGAVSTGHSLTRSAVYLPALGKSAQGKDKTSETDIKVPFLMHRPLYVFEKDCTGIMQSVSDGPVCGTGFLTEFLPQVFRILVCECQSCARGEQTTQELQNMLNQFQLAIAKCIPHKKSKSRHMPDEADAKTDGHRLMVEMKGGLATRLYILNSILGSDYKGDPANVVSEIPGTVFALWIPAISAAVVKKVKPLVREEEKETLIALADCAERLGKVAAIVKGRPDGLPVCVELYKKYLAMVDKLEMFCPKGQRDLAGYVVEIGKGNVIHTPAVVDAKAFQDLTEMSRRFERVLIILDSCPHRESGNPCGQKIVDVANLLLESGAWSEECVSRFEELVTATKGLPPTTGAALPVASAGEFDSTGYVALASKFALIEPCQKNFATLETEIKKNIEASRRPPTLVITDSDDLFSES